MEKLIVRLAKYINRRGISYNSFDKSIGTSNGYIGKQIKNEASVGSDVLEKISCSYPDLNMDWLITGKGNMLREISLEINEDDSIPPPAISAFLQLIREKDKENKKLAIEIGRLEEKLARAEETLNRRSPDGSGC